MLGMLLHLEMLLVSIRNTVSSNEELAVSIGKEERLAAYVVNAVQSLAVVESVVLVEEEEVPVPHRTAF
jgi:hypothetical protein